MTARLSRLLGRRQPVAVAPPVISVHGTQGPLVTAPGARRWHAFEARLADGVIKEGVICLANGDRVTIGPGTPVILGPGDVVSWRERRGWGWSMVEPGGLDTRRGSIQR
ncbi:MAG: hypothetical protein ACLP9C_14540 [Acidimicrobiales bacterium]